MMRWLGREAGLVSDEPPGDVPLPPLVAPSPQWEIRVGILRRVVPARETCGVGHRVGFLYKSLAPVV